MSELVGWLHQKYCPRLIPNFAGSSYWVMLVKKASTCSMRTINASKTHGACYFQGCYIKNSHASEPHFPSEKDSRWFAKNCLVANFKISSIRDFASINYVCHWASTVFFTYMRDLIDSTNTFRKHVSSIRLRFQLRLAWSETALRCACSMKFITVSYTHLTLPTICSV